MSGVVGVDPGKTGYMCEVSPCGDGTGRNDQDTTFFWPAPVEESEDGLRYIIPALVRGPSNWRAHGIPLVVIEEQAPRRHGTVKEGTVVSFVLGYGFGLWEASLVAAGFQRALVDDVIPAALARGEGPFYLIVNPNVWKRRMGCIADHQGEDTHAARRKATNAKSIEVAQRVDPSVDYRAVERTPGARTLCADKAVARLLCAYGQWILRGKT
jgi:hypothetical protein